MCAILLYTRTRRSNNYLNNVKLRPRHRRRRRINFKFERAAPCISYVYMCTLFYKYDGTTVRRVFAFGRRNVLVVRFDARKRSRDKLYRFPTGELFEI